jgi:glycosyltransferase involved in cell wall biosynthesis
MKVAIIDGIAAHYRLSLFQKLSQQTDTVYSIFASLEPLNGIKCIDPNLAVLPVSEGGLNWTFIDNLIIFKRIFWQYNVVKIAARSDFEILIFPGECQIFSTWISVAISKFRGRKVVFWGHGSYGNEKTFKKYFRKLFNKLPDAYLLYNERARDLLIKEGIKEEKLFLINNSLNHDSHLKIRNSLTKEAINQFKESLFLQNIEYPTLLFIGRLTKEKKVDQLIQSVEVLHRKDKKVNCVIVGSGEQESFLKELVRSLKLEQYVCFYGSSYDENENGLLISMADCIVSPGNVGLNAIHSMSFGTPVISHADLKHQGPEVSSIIEGFTGELFKKNSIGSLVDRIEELVFVKGKGHYSDNCLKMVDDYYTPEYQIKVFRSLIQYLTSKKN